MMLLSMFDFLLGQLSVIDTLNSRIAECFFSGLFQRAIHIHRNPYKFPL